MPHIRDRPVDDNLLGWAFPEDERRHVFRRRAEFPLDVQKSRGVQETGTQFLFRHIMVMGRKERQDTVAGFLGEAGRRREHLHAGLPVHIVIPFPATEWQEEKDLVAKDILDFPLGAHFILRAHECMIEPAEALRVGCIERRVGILFREIGDAARLEDGLPVEEIDDHVRWWRAVVFNVIGKAGKHPVIVRFFLVFHVLKLLYDGECFFFALGDDDDGQSLLPDDLPQEDVSVRDDEWVGKNLMDAVLFQVLTDGLIVAFRIPAELEGMDGEGRDAFLKGMRLFPDPEDTSPAPCGFQTAVDILLPVRVLLEFHPQSIPIFLERLVLFFEVLVFLPEMVLLVEALFQASGVAAGRCFECLELRPRRCDF